MKTVKIYNHNTGQWETIAGVSTTDGSINPEVIQTLIDGQQEILAKLDSIISRLDGLPGTTEPVSDYYVEYTIDNSASTFSLRSVDNPINNGHYIPQFSNGYDYIKLTLTDGSVTTNIETDASQVEKIKIYYPEETTSIKFKDTKVKKVEYINCTNITDATEMFQNCSSLEDANLTTLDSSKVTVDNTMFEGVNNDVQLTFNPEWSYTNRDMGLIKMIEVVAYLYREDGMYDFSRMYISSQYGELYNGLIFSHTDPTDERWRFEPLELEAGVTYSCYIGFEGVYGDTFELNFSENAEIYFVGVTPSSFTELRPEIGGNEEPEEEYITGFSVSDTTLGFSSFSGSYSITITPNETGRPMNFVVDELEHSNFKTGIDYNIQNTDMGANLQVSIRSHASYSSGQLVIRETYSNTTQTIDVFINPKISLTVHYKATDDDCYGDTLSLNFDVETQEIRLDPDSIDGYDEYGSYVQISVPGNSTCPAVLQHNNPNFSGMTMMSLNTTNSTMSIWISDDSSEILYENPNQPEEPDTPEEPSTYTLTINMYDPNGYSPSNMVFLEDASGNRHTCYLPSESTNDFGRYKSFELPGVATYSVDVQDVNGTITRLSSAITMDSNKEIWVIAGDSTLYTERPEIGGGDEPTVENVQLTLHYNRKENDYDNWDVWNWCEDGSHENTDGISVQFTGQDDFGVIAYLDVPKECNLGYIIRYGGDSWEDKDVYTDQFIQVNDNMEIWILQGLGGYYTERPNPEEEYPSGNITDFSIGIDSIALSPDNCGTIEFDIITEPKNCIVNFGYGRLNFDIKPYIDPISDVQFRNSKEKTTVTVSTGDILCNGTGILTITENNTMIEKQIPITFTNQSPSVVNLTIHYYNPDGIYDDGEGFFIPYGGGDFGPESDYGRYGVYQFRKGSSGSVLLEFHKQGNVFASKELTVTEDMTDMELYVIQDDPTVYTEVPECFNNYYVDYTINTTDGDDEVGSFYKGEYYHDTGYKYLPMSNNKKDIPSKVVITLNDDTTTEDLTTKVSNIKSIRAYYGPCANIQFKTAGYHEDNAYISITNRIKTVEYMNTSGFTTMQELFCNCQYLDSVNTSGWDTSKTTSFYELFYQCYRLKHIDVSNWDTSNVTDMSCMFQGCIPLTSLDLSSWNTSNVAFMSSMFQSCTSLTSLDLSSWDTSNVTAMGYMFHNCNSLTSLDLSNWNTSNVTSMDDMFSSIYDTNIKVSEGLWTLDTTPDAYGGSNLSFNIIPYDITSINVTTNMEDPNNLNTHKIKYNISITPAHGTPDLETVYDETYIKLNNDTITLLEGAQGKPLSVTFRSKRNNEISQTIEFTLNADYVIPAFDGTIDFTGLSPIFPSWMEEYSSGEYTFELGNFMEGVDGLVSNNSNIDNSMAIKAYALTPEENCTMTISYRIQSEGGCDYLTISCTTDGNNLNPDEHYINSSLHGDNVYEDISGSTELSSGVTYYLLFAYRKDGSVANGVDKACIRSIKFE